MKTYVIAKMLNLMCIVSVYAVPVKHEKPEPYKPVQKTESACEVEYKKYLFACWVNSNSVPLEGCYFAASPAQCKCMQAGGQYYTYLRGDKRLVSLCKWHEKACDAWRFTQGSCPKGGYEVRGNVGEKVTPEDYCELFGGTVSGDTADDKVCNRYLNNRNVRQTCNLNDLWHGKCGNWNESRR
jgi:hypothetical protein